MKSIIFFILLLLSSNCIAQRDYANCDSTEYTYKPDSAIVAGRQKLYFKLSTGLLQFSDFSTSDTDTYIRDFDIIHDNLWYTLVGLRYIGGPTQLYKSIDRGRTWVEDTSFYSVTRYYAGSTIPFYSYNSVNRVQKVAGSIILFVAYYESRLVYSNNDGNTWNDWFQNQIVHYQGLLECDKYYYLYGFNGDGFRAVMFPFAKSKLFTSDTGGAWSTSGTGNHPPCPQSTHPSCIFAPGGLNRCEMYQFFTDTLEEVCSKLPNSVPTIFHNQTQINIFPNPTRNTLTIETDSRTINNIKLIDATGKLMNTNLQRISSSSYLLSVNSESKGLALLVITSDDGNTLTHKILLE